jgi:signal transduction histidine kinase
MFNYLAFICGGISAPGRTPDADGVEMAAKCLKQLEETGNPEQFPPRLLILLTSPAYNDAEPIKQVLHGIRQTFAEYKSRIFADAENESDEVPLIGSSVEAVFFNQQIHDRGALLVCLASRLIEAEVRVSVNVRFDHENAVNDLLKQLELSLLDTASNTRMPLTGRLLLSFFPNIGRHDERASYLAPDLHQLLLQKARTRITLVGGVSSKPSFQFAGSEVCHDEMVAASIFTGSPFSTSFGHGLTGTDAYLRVKSLDADGRTINKFDQRGSPAEILKLKDRNDFALLSELSLDHNPLVTVAQIAANGKSVTMLRKVGENSMFRKLVINDFDHVRNEAKKMLEHSLRWWMLEKPVGCLAIHCSSRRRSGLDFKTIAEDAEEVINRENERQAIKGKGIYFGGFFDGEFGADEFGRFLFGNWSIATLCFSDEMRDRTPAHTGFKAISDAAPSLTSVFSLDDALEHSLKLIFDTGFPGAMISLLMENKDSKCLIAKKAIGSRFKKIVEMTKRPLNQDDILAIVARKKEPEFIPDSSQDPRCDQEAVRKSGIISQYILPLLDHEQHLIAVLQFDLGDLRRREAELHKAEERILKSLGPVVGATTLRVLNREEADIGHGLDEALRESLRADTRDEALQNYIKLAVKHFKVEMGHIRLPKPDEGLLEMVAGTGEYYEIFKSIRQKIGIKSTSPTSLAYNKNSSVVVNDAVNDGWRQALLESCRDNKPAYDAYEKALAYANVPVRDDNGNPIGTISLISHRRWFFTRSQVKALDVLGHCVGYLLDHFKRREAEGERKFLLDISSDFVRKADFRNKSDTTINEAVKRFREAANADIASLFIWDKEVERFILRAQDGWAYPEWVDAARYKKGERWTGTVALEGSPRYIPDMYAHKKEHNLISNRGYSSRAFGTDLSEYFTFEAIGLPLRLKDQETGVLTLFRRIDPKQSGKGSGFTTTDQKILQEAADTMSAMLSALLYKLRMDWFKDEMKRHEAVREALERGDRSVPIEQRLCCKMVESCYAIKANLYLAPSDEKQISLRWVAGAAHCEDAVPKVITVSTPTEADEMLFEAAKNKTLREKRHELSGEEWSDPETAKTERLIERISLPLLNEDQLIGVLDLHYRVKRKKFPLVTGHDPKQLEELARKIILAYLQQKQLEEAEISKLGVQVMGAMFFQSGHRMVNLMQSIRSLSIQIEAATSDNERRERLSELFNLTKSATEGVKQQIDVARQMKDIRLRPCYLRSLVVEALLGSNLSQSQTSPDVKLLVPEKMMVQVDQRLTQEAFRNIIHNSMKAMPQGGTLTISAESSNDQKVVHVTFADTGTGMSEEQIQKALSGFVATQSGMGLGVFVSLMMIRAQNGDMKIESAEGIGTNLTVSLPLSRVEEPL